VAVRTTIEELRYGILRFVERHGAGNVSLLGSVARGEHNAESDVDSLVDVIGETTHGFRAVSSRNSKSFLVVVFMSSFADHSVH